ncbi:hypothetical protein LELG_00807 [Lodderomyces elongisporus NRRL YB-4239]|uniref:Uncharacterized protein n=1 Tax=Lodderomyces elongisporus (strain ATCC 11503 / CBS 2605 / JCM 1781 / NBRC 1676 / NRRL YB-4239) TaxID=379508 RepID=A5DTX1_LODEL|nr:hypothetical protein LELG_00807 [Lodderomyces elongisporus NRRL YB-4239]
MLDKESDEDIEQQVEFEFAIPPKGPVKNFSKRHNDLAFSLRLPTQDKFIQFVFTTLINLCDPYTQPEETEKYILSVSCVSDLLISLSFSYYYEHSKSNGSDNALNNELEMGSIKFAISTTFFNILQLINKYLNAGDEVKLRFIDNGDDQWQYHVAEWTPSDTDPLNLNLVYSMSCVLIMSLQKLFDIKKEKKKKIDEKDEIDEKEEKEEGKGNGTEKGKQQKEEKDDDNEKADEINDTYCNLLMNPYLHYFLKLWKCHTNIILLGLEIDRRIEFQNHENNEENETPPIIVATLKGSSSIRYVLAWIINQNPSLSPDDDDDDEDDDNDDEIYHHHHQQHQQQQQQQENLSKNIDDSPHHVLEKEHLVSNFDLRSMHDLENESLMNFIQPLARKKANGGAILVDMRLVIIGLLIIYSGTTFVAGDGKSGTSSGESEEQSRRRLNRSKPLAEIGDLLIDLEYADRFDEDIRYMLEYDLDEDGSECECECACKCEMEGVGDKNDFKEDSVKYPEVNHASVATSIVKNENVDIQFDEFGRDWRDIPRGENIHIKPSFLEKFRLYDESSDKTESDDFFTSWKELHDVFDFLCVTSIEGNTDAERLLGQTAVNTIAKAVKEYGEESKKMPEINPGDVATSKVTTDLIHMYLTAPAPEEFVKVVQDNNKAIIPILSITHFELMLHTNNKLARAMMDEMFMCEGHRRLLVWFLTHELNLSNILIDYVFELATGLRGGQVTNAPYQFSRLGDKLILSDVEQLMLLHEFFTSSAFYLSADKGIEIDGGYEVVLAESIAKKLMILLCLMINQLIKRNVIKIEASSSTKDEIYDYSAELLLLLISWIGKVPEARQLYFQIKNASLEQPSTSTTGISPTPDLTTPANKTTTTAAAAAATTTITTRKPTTKSTTTKPTEPTTANPTLAAAGEMTTFQSKRNERLIQIDDERALFFKYNNMTIEEIANDLDLNIRNMRIVNNFIVRMEANISIVLNKNASSQDLEQIEDDFRFFLLNFNTFGKIDNFIELLFRRFEDVITTGDVCHSIETAHVSNSAITTGKSTETPTVNATAEGALSPTPFLIEPLTASIVGAEPELEPEPVPVPEPEPVPEAKPKGKRSKSRKT